MPPIHINAQGASSISRWATPPNQQPPARPTTSDADYLTYLRNLFLAAQKDKKPRLAAWDRNYKIIMNRYQSAVFASWAPQPRDSEVYPILSSLVAWLTDQEPDIGFLPAANPNSDFYTLVNKAASDLTAIFNTNWINEEYDRHVKLMLWDGLMCGTGIVKSLWDNAAADGAGNAVLRRVDPYKFYPDPNASSIDDAEYLIETRRLTLAQIKRMYPHTAHLMLSGSSNDMAERPKLTSASTASSYQNLGSLPNGTASWGRNSASGSTPTSTLYTVYEYWLKENTYDDLPDDDTPGDNTYATPRWKMVVVCNGNILAEEWAEDLWDHACHPYDDWRFDDIGEFWGISLVDHLALPQLYINRLLTALEQNAELAGNPIFVEASNSGTPRATLINRPGERISVNSASAQSNLPRWMTPPSMPTSVMDLVNFWISRIENTAGINGMQKGQDPSQRVSNNTVSSVQEAAFVRIRSALTNLQWTYRRASNKLGRLIAQNYTEARIVAILGDDGTGTSLYLRPYHFYDPESDGSEPFRFIIRADAGASNPTSRSARIQMVQTLFAMGAVDDQYVLEVFGVRDGKEILQRLYYKRQNGLVGATGGQRQRAQRSS